MLFCVLTSGRAALAQPVAPAPAVPAVEVGAVAILGLQALRPADFADLIGPRMGTTMSAEDLAALATAIATRARDRGYAFATARIDPQQVQTGVLAVAVDEGRIDEIRLQGADHKGVRAALAPLVTGQPVRIAEVERRLLLAGDIPGVRVLGTRFTREEGKGVLTVSLLVDRIAGRATFANDGTRVLGPEQVVITADINGLIAADDAVSLTWSATPFQPGDLQFGRIRYEKRISRSGTAMIVTGSMALARPGDYLQPLAIRTRSWQGGLSVLQPLLRRRTRSLWLEADLTVNDLEQTRAGVLAADERVVSARAALHGYTRLGPGRLRASLGLAQGLGVLGASPADNPLAFRPGADLTFTALDFWSEWTGPLHGPLSLRLAMQAQLASGPVPVAKEFGLGGNTFLRGYDWYARSGDEEIVGLAELGYMLDRPLGAVKRTQVYAFVDGGAVRRLGGDPGTDRLASAGGGVRADVTQSLGANLELAVPLSDTRAPGDSGRPKVNFRLNKTF